MSDALTSVAEKLGPMIRMLSSDKDGDVIAAARAIGRTLRTAGADFHALADHLTQVNDKKFSEADAAEIYRRGVEDGKREVENGPMFRNVNIDDEPSWNEIARECAAHPVRMMGERERDFVKQMVRRTARGGEPTHRC
jgi:hypothetical protein